MKLLQNGTNKPFTITVASTKGGSAKSTNAANIGAFCAEHGLRTLLIDTDTQPTLSSYYVLNYQAPGGTYEFLHFRDVEPSHIISKTTTHLFFGDTVLLNNLCLTLQKEE